MKSKRFHDALEERVRRAETEHAAAVSRSGQTESELRAARRALRDAQDRERVVQRAAADLAYERLRGDNPIVPAELAPLVRKLEPALRASIAERKLSERAALVGRGIGYVKLDQFEQPVGGAPARRRGFADDPDEG